MMLQIFIDCGCYVTLYTELVLQKQSTNLSDCYYMRSEIRRTFLIPTLFYFIIIKQIA